MDTLPYATVLTGCLEGHHKSGLRKARMHFHVMHQLFRPLKLKLARTTHSANSGSYFAH